VNDLNSVVNILQSVKEKLSHEYAVKEIAIFGSYVKGKQSSKSDIDILIDFWEIPSLITFMKLKYMLTDIIGINVDLVMKSSLKPVIGKKILQEAVRI